jgi:hypothetical protein
VKVEKAVLGYLSQFSDAELVAQHLAAARGKDLEDREREFQGVLKAVADPEHQFLQHLNLLKRGIISELEFVKANEAARCQVGALESRRDELSQWLEGQRGRVAAAKGLPEAIRSFLEEFQELDVRRQKAQLQTILKAAYVYRDDRLELEFRE